VRVDLASGNGAEDVDAPHSSDANIEPHDSGAEDVDVTPVVPDDEAANESQIMLTAASNPASGGSGDGILSERDMTYTQFEVATESCVKRCAAQLVNTLAYKRRRKLWLPSTPVQLHQPSLCCL